MSQHVVPARTNLTIFAILMALLVLTIAVAFVNIGRFGTPIALLIATAKAVLILLFFMHVRFSSKLVWIFSGAAFFWLLILLALTFNDYYARGWIEVIGK